jgi:hypothetical protein
MVFFFFFFRNIDWAADYVLGLLIFFLSPFLWAACVTSFYGIIKLTLPQHSF